MNVIDRLLSLRHDEHASTVAIVEALLECDRTKAHLEAGFPSVWALLVEGLHYSNAAASRRYKAMKCARKFPVVLEMLREHRVSLSSLAKVESLLASIDDPQSLLVAIDGRSQPEVERVVARARPVGAKPRERVRRVFVKAPEDGSFGAKTESSSAAEVESREDSPADDAPNERVVLTLSLDPEAHVAFERARAILSRKTGPGPSIETCLNELVSFYLKHKEPKAPRPPKKTRGRRIPTATRDAVLRRDRERCTYVAPDGRRCTATHDLQLDHVHPYALGGTSDEANLRVMCAKHNRWRAQRRFGRYQKGDRAQSTG